MPLDNPMNSQIDEQREQLVSSSFNIPNHNPAKRGGDLYTANLIKNQRRIISLLVI